MNLDIIASFTRMLIHCKRFEHVDGVPTLTVGEEMYRSIKDCVDRENLCVMGDRRGYDFDPILTICGVVLKLEE